MKKVRLGTTKVGENVYEIKIVGRGPKAIKVSRVETIDGYTDEYTDFINNADVYGDNENYLALKSCAKHSFDEEIVEYIETPLFSADVPGGIDREAEKAWALSQIA